METSHGYGRPKKMWPHMNNASASPVALCTKSRRAGSRLLRTAPATCAALIVDSSVVTPAKLMRRTEAPIDLGQLQFRQRVQDVRTPEGRAAAARAIGLARTG